MQARMSSLRLIASQVLRTTVLPRVRVSVSPRIVATPNKFSLWRQYSSQKAEESEEEFDARWEAYFNREDIDAWELKKGLNDLYGHDLVPEPKIVIAMLKAARRLNDVPLAVRILEAVKQKAAGDKAIYNHVLSAVKPTLEELGLRTPEELGLS